jgi:gliding motility-associated-like protein
LKRLVIEVVFCKKIATFLLCNLHAFLIHAQYQGIEWLTDYNSYANLANTVVNYNSQRNEVFKQDGPVLIEKNLKWFPRDPQVFKLSDGRFLFQNATGVYNYEQKKTYTYSELSHFTNENQRFVNTDKGLIFEMNKHNRLYSFSSARLFFDFDSVIYYKPAKLYKLDVNTFAPNDSFVFSESGGVGHGFVRHSNNEDVWVICRNPDFAKIDVYKIDSSGVEFQNSVSCPDVKSGKIHGTFLFSPDGSKGALLTGYYQKSKNFKDSFYWTEDFNGRLLLFDFSAATGNLSNFKFIYSKKERFMSFFGQMAFSGDSRYLFANLGDSLRLIDFDSINGGEEICLENANFRTASTKCDLKTLYDGNIYYKNFKFFNDSVFVGSISFNDFYGFQTDERSLYIGDAKDHPEIYFNGFQRTLYPLYEINKPIYQFLCAGDTALMTVKFGYCDSASIEWGNGVVEKCKNGNILFKHTYHKNGDFILSLRYANPWQGVIQMDTQFHVTLKFGIKLVDTFFCQSDTLRVNLDLIDTNLLWAENNSNIMNIADSGNYTFLFKDAWCAFTDSVYVSEHIKPWKKAFIDTVICQGESIFIAAPSGLKIQWNGSPADSVLSKRISNSGIQFLQFSDGFCTYHDTFFVKIAPKLNLTVIQTDSNLCHFFSPMEFRIRGALANMKSISWNSEIINTDKITTNNLNPFVVTATDTNGCKETVIVTPFSLCNPRIFIPNAFTPNSVGPEANEEFIPVVNDGTITRFEIYNRWGEKIFLSDGVKGWDGTYKQTNSPEGVYFYGIEVETISNNVKFMHRFSGEFYLLR